VRQAHLQPGMNVLVAGGAGSVGHFVIQMAKARGATVLTTVSSDAKAQHALAAGADHVINYRSEDVGAQVKAITGGAGVYTVIEMDLSGNAKLYPAVFRQPGHLVVYGMNDPQPVIPGTWLMYNSIGISFVFIYEISEEDRKSGIVELTRMLEAGALQHTVAQHLPLAEAARGHEQVEEGKLLGNLVLDID
jgi:NADPH:quinone reductase